MKIIKDIIIYILKHYPDPKQLSKDRLIKMIYLADWKSAIDRKVQIANLNWHYDHYGPTEEVILNLLEMDTDFDSIPVNINAHQHKDFFNLNNISHLSYNLNHEVTTIIDYVISVSYNLNWSDFVKLVYSTYPIASGQKYTDLNLITSAKDYRKNEAMFA